MSAVIRFKSVFSVVIIISISFASQNAIAETRIEAVSKMLALDSALGITTEVDPDCPISSASTLEYVKRFYSKNGISLDITGPANSAIVVSVRCMPYNGTLLYTASLSVESVVSNVYTTLFMQGAGIRLPIMNLYRYGTLGEPPKELQAKGIVDEIELLLEDFLPYWNRSREEHVSALKLIKENPEYYARRLSEITNQSK